MSIFLEALLIFGLRVLGITISTLATLMTVQGRRFYAMAAGFIGALVYIIAIGLISRVKMSHVRSPKMIQV